MDNALADAAADARYEDRRKGLRDEGPMRPEVAHALFEATRGWLLETEPVAIRGSHLALTRDRYRETVDATRPIALEHLTLMEVDDDNRGRSIVLFDSDDINGAIGELTARWIASGEVAHPEVIEAMRKLHETTNRHEWDALAARCAGATYINHRLLGTPASADYISSIQALATLVPDLWVEAAEILTHSASGLVIHVVMKGTSTEGLAIEIPFVMLMLLDGDRVKHIETYDPDHRDLALVRFEELNRSS